MANENIAQRECTVCTNTLPISSFNSNSKGGFRRQCRGCCADAKFARRMHGKSETEVQAAKERLQHARAIKRIAETNPDMKWCAQCDRFQARTMFSACSRNPSGLQVYCRKCRSSSKAKRRDHYRAKAKEWRDRTIDQRKAYDATYYIANRDKFSDHNRKYREQNKYQARVYARQYYQSNKARWIKRQQERYQSKREEILDKCHAYYRGHKQQYKEYSRARSARKRSAQGSYTVSQWQDKLAYWGYRCYLCRNSLHNQSIHLEHRTPLTRGGSNWIANIAPACGHCNRRKHTKTEAEYRAILAA